MCYFIITIDAEGDNQWKWDYGQTITTDNANFLCRFQDLCEKYHFKPTYLATYEMLKDATFVSLTKQKIREGKCEVGIHPHAWSTPPEYELEGRIDCKPGHPYLMEYPKDVIRKKIREIIHLYKEVYGCYPASHRAGKWGMSSEYFDVLSENGIKFDCSVTPGIDWSRSKGYSEGSCGSNYTKISKQPYVVNEAGLLEIPMSIGSTHCYLRDHDNRIKHIIGKTYRMLKGKKNRFFRPKGDNLQELLYMIQHFNRNNTDYLMFMLHSSEMMPGGSPTFTDEMSIEQLFSDMEKVFCTASLLFKGVTLSEYGGMKRNNNGK